MSTLHDRMVSRWSLGVDPGFKCTALVLMGDLKPVAAAAARDDDARRPIQHRVRKMAAWFQNTIQEWINEREIQELNVIIEMPFLKAETDKERRGVVTLITQMRMIAAYEEALFRLEGCRVKMGEVANTTAKAIFTGRGNADKSMMITFSAWGKRPDVKEREHLADAQGIGTCYPSMVQMDNELALPTAPLYVDNEIGNGPNWKGKV